VEGGSDATITVVGATVSGRVGSVGAGIVGWAKGG
jgi:hypothetical protein